MGRRMDTLRELIGVLRTAEPKYSFEMLIFNIVVGLAAVACTLLGKQRLWLILFAVLWISLGIQGLRIRRVIKRQLAQTKQMVDMLDRVALAFEQLSARKHQPLDPAELALLREDVKRAQQREAAGGE